MKNSKKKIISVSMAALTLLSLGMSSATSSLAATSTKQSTTNKKTSTKPPKKPSGKKGQKPPKMPSGKKGQKPPTMKNGKMAKPGANTQTYDYTGKLSGATTASKSKKINHKTLTSSKKDQNTVLAKSKANLTIKDSTLNKSGSSTNDDNTNFYGTNSILLTTGKNAQTNISNSKLKSNATGANGIFATNKGTVNSNNNTITTTGKANSRGLDATYGGTIIANKTNISTKGDHSAAVATDRGGGNVSVTNSTLKTQGSGSPLAYSTGRIEYNNVTGTSSGSQIAGMEGLNTILLNNSNLTSTSNKISGSDPIKNGVIIYQSTSGDAETKTSSAARFQATNSSLKTNISSGTMFYLTNTTANVVLKNTKLDFNSDKVNLLTVKGNNSNGWGSYGANGAKVNFTGIDQTLKGDISVDNISQANVYLLSNSTYTGKTSITTNKKAKSSAKTKSPLTMNVSSNSKWVVTDNSTVTNLNVQDGGKIVDKDGKSVTIVDSNGKTLVKGTSDYKVTVTGKYSTSFSTTSANKISSNKISRSKFDKKFGTKTSYQTN